MSKRWPYVAAACVGAAILLMASMYLRAQKATVEPEAVGGATLYYTGPRESKGHPGVWADESGHIVPPPAEVARRQTPASNARP